MINLSIGFIFGFTACLACWLKRSIEQCRALDAADEQIATLRRRERRYQQALSIVRDRARDINQTLDLGNVAPLPATAENLTGQHVPQFTLRISSGSSRPRRSRFF